MNSEFILETRNLTRDSGARDKDAAWSPDGKTIAYISDKSGEYEIYLVSPNGRESAVSLTQNKDGYRHTLRWSPDSKKIAFADHTACNDYRGAAAIAANVSVPMLLVLGDQDVMTRPSAAEPIANAAPNATTVIVEGAGHLLFVERPDVVNEALVEFLIGVDQ